MSVLENYNLKRREDQPKGVYSEEAEPPYLKVAPARDGHFYVVPKQKSGGAPMYDEWVSSGLYKTL